MYYWQIGINKSVNVLVKLSHLYDFFKSNNNKKKPVHGTAWRIPSKGDLLLTKIIYVFFKKMI